MDEPVPPFWFKQRQGKMESAGEGVLRLTAPNQEEAFIGTRKGENGRWAGFFKKKADSEEIEASEPIYELASDAWGVAFEIYRRQMIV